MRLRDLHPWGVRPAEAVEIQQRLATEVVSGPPLDPAHVRLIAGVDVSSERGNPTLTAGVVVATADTFEIVATTSAQAPATFPYVPGLLAFREVPVVARALEKLDTVPDVFLVDGQGQAHPRRFGIACHVGLLVDRPTVGVAKSLLVGRDADPGPQVGDSVPLLDRGEEVGRIVRAKERTHSLYISVGHRIDLASAVALVLRCVREHRLPEPARLAHLHVNAVRRTGQGLTVSTPQPIPQQRLL